MDYDYEVWLRYAERDLKTGEIALREGIYWDARIHAQQTVEKCLKSLLLYQNIDTPRTHNLESLLIFVDDNRLSKFADETRTLNNFYTPIRYPDTDTDLGEEDFTETVAAGAIGTAVKIYRVTRRIITGDR